MQSVIFFRTDSLCQELSRPLGVRPVFGSAIGSNMVKSLRSGIHDKCVDPRTDLSNFNSTIGSHGLA